MWERALPTRVGVLLLAMGLGSTRVASALLINVDFNATNSGATGGYPGDIGPGVVGGSSYFNSLGLGPRLTSLGPYTSPQLVASDGTTTTTVTVSLSNHGDYDTKLDSNEGEFVAGRPLFNDYAYDVQTNTTNFPAGNSPVPFSIAGLVNGGIYDLYVFSQNGGYNSSTTVFTIGAMSKTVTNDTSDAQGPTGFVQTRNYEVFPGLIATGGTISGSFVTGKAGNAGAFNGFQIMQVPEPASFGLFAVGLVGMALLVRRRQLIAFSIRTDERP